MGCIFKKGISQACFPGEITLKECFALAKAAGFDGVELRLSETGEFSLDLDNAGLRNIKRLAGESLEICSIMGGLQWKYPLTSEDESIREKGFRAAEKALQYAAALGADTVLLIPGVVVPQVPYEVAYGRAKEGLAKLAEVADNYGVHIGIENVWNRFLLSPMEMRSFIDEIGHRSVGAYFDVGNVMAFGYPEHWICTLKERIVKVHVKDFKTDIGNVQGFTYPLQGDVDWKRVVQALHRIEYRGYLTAEVPLPRSGLATTIQYISNSMSDIITIDQNA